MTKVHNISNKKEFSLEQREELRSVLEARFGKI